MGLDREGVIRFANSAAGDLLRCESDELLGRCYSALLQPGWNEEHPDRDQIRLVTEGNDTVFYRVDGRSFPVACRPGAVTGDSQVTSVVLFEDISARKAAEAALRKRAEQDPLTGLANRGAFQDFLNGALARARRSQKQIGLLYLDLDGFKKINDQHGHQVGDQVLTGIAQRLVETVREGDLVGRLGGDEFVVVLDDVAGNLGCEVAARNISGKLNLPHPIGSLSVRCPTSIGIAVFPDLAEDEAALLTTADRAMYRQKSKPGRQVA